MICVGRLAEWSLAPRSTGGKFSWQDQQNQPDLRQAALGTKLGEELANPSFDIVSKVDHQEVDNAVNQTAKELSQRYDFRGTGAAIAWAGEAVIISAEAEPRALAALDVFKEKLVRRNVSLKALDAGEPRASGKITRIECKIEQGIAADKAKVIGKKIRDEGPKGVQVQIQGDELRVSAKSKDDLQTVIALLKQSDFGIALQFTNYR